MEVVLTNAEHDSSLLNAFSNYLEKEDYLDITFICKGGRKVKAHQLVLLCVSPFLKKMFSDWSGNQEMIITVPDADYNVLKLVLNFLYEGTMKLSESEFVEFKAIHKMLGIKFPSGFAVERRIQQFPRKQPPPLLKLDNNINSALLRMECSVDHNEVAKKKIDTSSIENKNCIMENNARQLANPVDEPPTPDGKSRDPDDDPLNVPDIYFVTTNGPTSQTQEVNINGNKGTVRFEGEGHNLQTASSYSPSGQQRTRHVNDHNAYSNSLIKQSGSRTEKRPYACIAVASDTEHTFGVNLEQMQRKRVKKRNKFANFMPVTDQNSNSAVNSEGIQFRRTKTKKT